MTLRCAHRLGLLLLHAGFEVLQAVGVLRTALQLGGDTLLRIDQLKLEVRELVPHHGDAFGPALGDFHRGGLRHRRSIGGSKGNFARARAP